MRAGIALLRRRRLLAWRRTEDEVRWSVAGRMAVAWVLTLPAAGLVGALAYAAAHGVGGTAGTSAIVVVLAACATGFYLASRRTAVTASRWHRRALRRPRRRRRT